MDTERSRIRGLWLPLITPFRDGKLDEISLRRLCAHYAGEPIDGFVLAATTGEGLTLDENETESLARICDDELLRARRRVPLFLGLCGSDTRRSVAALCRTAAWPIDGYLIACPPYSRPSQEGLFQHFSALADRTERPILVYNIPYRTGVNLSNETMLRLAQRPNIVGTKDCSADRTQSFDLLRGRPADFAVLTGEDALVYDALVQGADGAILASAHIETRSFAAILDKLRDGDQGGALAGWRALADLPRLLFTEPSPAPIKHWLWRTGLIDSPELRLPMIPVTAPLGHRIDTEIERLKADARRIVAAA